MLSNPIDALVDSGADRNLFPLSFATDFLGLNFKKTKPVIIRGIGNAIVEAYPGKLNLWVAGQKFQTDADFSASHNLPILGRNGFFNLFSNISFDLDTSVSFEGDSGPYLQYTYARCKSGDEFGLA